MAENSKIEWTDHTFNSWIGCTRVSPGCVHCYAESFSKRYNKAEWGPAAQRVKTGAAYWKKPLKWNKAQWFECFLCGWRGVEADIDEHRKTDLVHMLPHKMLFSPTRQRVFVASMADVFEDNPQVANWRGELFQLMDETPNLDWLILTKRPERIFSLGTDAVGEVFDNWLARHPNVWGGTSVESWEYLDPRVDALRGVCFKVSFLSVEPMLGPVRLAPRHSALDWVICGGESGAGCRQMDAVWARDLQEDCHRWDIKFFMKQMGGHPNKRDQLSDLPEDLRIREWPTPLPSASPQTQRPSAGLGGEEAEDV